MDSSSFVACTPGMPRLEWNGCIDGRIMAFFSAIRSVQRDAVVGTVEDHFGLSAGLATAHITAEHVHRRRSAEAGKQYAWLGACSPKVSILPA
jgi:hypothetical protein